MKNNKKCIICVGIPAAGKSTWTKEYLSKHPNTVAVSRDDFRYGLRNSGVTEPKIEDMITELVNLTIEKSLMRGFDVIVDQTSCKQKYINNFIELFKFKADIEFRVFDTPLETCILRDSKRERKVGENVIRKMHKDYKLLCETFPFQNITKRTEHENLFNPLKQDESLPKAVIFDVDGNISENTSGRSPYDWDKVDNDSPIDTVIEQLKLQKSIGRKILIVSGRDETARIKTEEWLEFYKIPYDEMFMRKANDFRRDSIVKKEIFNQEIKDNFNVIAVWDDRLQVCIETWYELGLFCFCTNQGLKSF